MDRVVVTDGCVRLPAGWWTPTVHPLLRHLRCSDEEAIRRHNFKAAPHRRRRIAVFAESYGLASVHGLVDAVIDRQRLDIAHVRQMADQHVEPQRSWVEQGYLDELAARISWSQKHRHLLQ